ncbi:hypothetical protein ACFQ4C_10000 [Larkinella insperata]|uniref:Lipoprotein n=1 Tax=Larkinella insperata TaxID=332158 RepID=A0ABW3Q4L5_9BACT|nr:hypothetical protein [Larkinella insperata]
MNLPIYLRYFILCIFLLTAWSCEDIDPEDQEQAAVVTGQDSAFCGSCGGWFIEVNNVQYRADVPAQFACPATRVWIQYELDESDGSKKGGKWIKIQSIRRRMG